MWSSPTPVTASWVWAIVLWSLLLELRHGPKFASLLNNMASVTARNWMNRTVFAGDNLRIMRGMNSATVDLAYLDPPFNTKRAHSASDDSDAAGAEFKDVWSGEDIDTDWSDLIESKHPVVHALCEAASEQDSAYLTYMTVRLFEIHRLLKPTGSMYLHCDPRMSHYLKIVSDMIFGREQFRNEIVWCYSSGGASRKRFSRKHDVLLLYGRGPTHVHNVLRVPYATQHPSKSMKALFHPDGKMLQDWWADIGIISTTGLERCGYPTQKPMKLLRRIIEASSNHGDIVLDPFCGSGTTVVAAEQLGREWVGIDLSETAAEMVIQRVGDIGNGLLVTQATSPRPRTDL